MIPSALFAILAISRIGAIHAVVFGGFASVSLAQRIDASKPKAIMTASCGVEGAKGPVDYKPFIHGALRRCTFKPGKIIIWQRERVLKWDPIARDEGERDWKELVESAKSRGVKCDPVPVKSDEGLYIIYTSGESHLLSIQKLSTIYASKLSRLSLKISAPDGQHAIKLHVFILTDSDF